LIESYFDRMLPLRPSVTFQFALIQTLSSLSPSPARSCHPAMVACLSWVPTTVMLMILPETPRT